MAVFMVPARDEEPWPTLGPLVWEWMLDNLVYGPGDLRGVPLWERPPDDEFKAWVYRLYEVYPRDHPQAGRRRFKRAAISMRKGTAKTEKAAWIAAAELSPDAPVRCVGWTLERGEYVPVGGPVQDPYIPMVAYTEEQTEELAYGALKVIVEESDLVRRLDPGVERIARRDGHGKAVALSSSPNANDGARTTFQHFDETHRMVLPRLKAAYQTMQANIPKRFLADAWSLETTTAFTPGEGSVAEGTWAYAEEVRKGKVKDPRLFFFHRQAGDHHKLDDDATEEEVRAAVEEASGRAAAAWSDLDSIVAQWFDPQTDRAYFRRVWLNQLVRGAAQAFDMERFESLRGDWAPEGWTQDPATGAYVPSGGWLPAKGSLIVLGFDGSRVKDATALVGVDVATARMFTLGVWERPPGIQSWEVPYDEVDEAVTSAFSRWDVWRMYADPPYWETAVAAWAGRFGKYRRAKGAGPRVFEWWTNRTKQMALAVKAYEGAIRAGEFTHDGHPLLVAHHGHARRQDTNHFDEDRRLFTIRKERPDSPHKIDAAMAAILAWEAYRDAIAAGVKVTRSRVPVSF